MPLNQIEWTADNLRRELQRLIQAADVSALDLIEAFDRSDDGNFEAKEFLAMIKRITRDDDLYEEHIRGIALTVFEAISGKDGQVDVEELMKWLNHDKATKYSTDEEINQLYNTGAKYDPLVLTHSR